MEPLTTWNCDRCGALIESAENAYVIWQRLGTNKEGNFKIVHQAQCDPGSENFELSMPLDSFLGEGGLAHLLSFLSRGPIIGDSDDGPSIQDFGEYVDFVRRVQTPYYEESRIALHHDSEIRNYLSDNNEYAPYMPETLKKIADGTLLP